MKYFKLFPLSIIIFTSFKYIHAQTSGYNFEIIKGTVLDDSTDQFIPSANFYNESKRNWDNANEKGEFELWVNIGDTIVLSAIGYLSEVLIVDSSMLSDSLVLFLQQRSYEIGEAIIKAPKTYSKFKQDVINLQLPKTELDSVTEDLAKISKKVVAKAEYDRMVSDVFNREKGTLFVLGASIRGKTDKEKKKLNKITKNSENQSIIEKKYNRLIVKQYTNLEDNDITNFMIFCNFSDEFILESNEYEIAKEIIKKLKEYRQNVP